MAIVSALRPAWSTARLALGVRVHAAHWAGAQLSAPLVAGRLAPFLQAAASGYGRAASAAASSANGKGGGESVGAADENMQMWVRGDSDVAGVGGAVAARIRRFGRATLRSMGPNAAYRAVKAAVNASEYLQEDNDWVGNHSLALTIHEEYIQDDTPVRRKVLVMEARLSAVHGNSGSSVAGPRAMDVSQSLVVGAHTNAGKAAAAVAHKLRPRNGPLTVRAMGAKAVHQALIAAAFAQRYLDTDSDNVKFVVTPRFEEAGDKQKQLMLCFWEPLLPPGSMPAPGELA